VDPRKEAYCGADIESGCPSMEVDRGVGVRPQQPVEQEPGVSAGLANKRSPPHAPAMFVVTEADAAAIRTVYEQRGEFAAAVELRRRFPGIADNAHARECVRTIAGWKPLPLRPVKRMPKVLRLRRML
jgi:hypothetical protein